MIKINKLYSEPEIFDPIFFDYGVNIIMGEKSDSTNKKIGVGKSVCIEFINFCLLKRIADSRLNLIPKNKAPFLGCFLLPPRKEVHIWQMLSVKILLKLALSPT